MKVSIWCRTGPFDSVSCRSRDLDTGLRAIARKLGYHTDSVSLIGGEVIGSAGAEPIRQGTLCRRDKYGTHTIAKISWVKV